MILLSAHKDIVMHNYRFDFDKGKYIGLLDNAVGMMVVNGLFMSESNICLLESQGQLKVFFGDSEEWGTITGMPVLKKEDIALVVDVCGGGEYKNVDIALENISGFSKKEVGTLKENLEWEGFKIKTKFYTGKPEEEDEAWYWKKEGNKVITFIIPIELGKGGWHIPDCEISIAKVVKSIQILKRTINYLL